MVMDGYDAIGHPIPPRRMGNAYAAAKEMGLSTDEAMLLVGQMADALERDDPYRALLDGSIGYVREGLNALVDLTGRYRLVATLLTG
jgi:hypothetical protein